MRARGAFIISAFFLTAGVAFPATFTVNTTNDTHCTGFVSQAAPGCTAASDSGGNISLRSALEDASTVGGSTTIDLPSGTYSLSLGDLVAGTQANTTIDLSGQGTPADTTIQQTQTGFMVIVVNRNVNANVVFSMENVTVSGGSENENDPDGFGGNGGAILAGGSSSATGNAVTITNAVFSANFCSPVSNAGCSGGAISMAGGGNLTVLNSTFSGNAASKNSGFGAGGAIYFDNGGQPGNVSITDSTFTSNTANGNATTGGQGGALRLSGGAGTTHAITGCTFTGNTANGTAAAGANGGAITVISGDVTASGNRITGNTSAAASGLFIGNNANTWGDARTNWWGCNGGPNTTGCDTTSPSTSSSTPLSNGQIAFSPWIVLSNTPNPSTINSTGGLSPHSTTLTASFLQDSNGGSLTAGQVGALPGVAVTWNNAILGSLSGAQTAIQASGTATATFTAGASGGPGHADATVDNATATADITIDQPPSVTLNPGGQTACAGVTVTFTAAATGVPAPTVQWQVSTNGGGSFSNVSGAMSMTLSVAAPTQSGFEYRAVFSNAAGTATSAAATLTVNPMPDAAGSVSGAAAVCQGQTGVGYSVGTIANATSYVWSYSGTGATINGSGNSVTVDFASNATGGNIAVHGQNSCGNGTPAQTTITVNVPPGITAQPSGQTVSVGQSVSFTAAASGSPAPTVQWQVSTDGGGSFSNVPSATSATLTFTAAASQNGDEYRAVFTNSCTSATSNAVTLTVTQAPAITSADSATFTQGLHGSFTVMTTGAPVPSLGDGGASLPSGVTFTDNSDGTATLSGTPAVGTAGTDHFTITASNGIGSPATQSFTLTVNASAPAGVPALGGAALGALIALLALAGIVALGGRPHR